MEAIFDYQPWLLGDDEKPVTIVDGRKQGKGLAALLPGFDDRNRAAILVGQQICVERDQMPPTEEGEYYWADLEGLTVVTTGGLELGRVDRMMETGANDVMVVNGDRERLIPFVQGQYVKRVDLEAELIEVDWDPEF
jgi:16S rRNA processing protein RimM